MTVEGLKDYTEDLQERIRLLMLDYESKTHMQITDMLMYRDEDHDDIEITVSISF